MKFWQDFKEFYIEPMKDVKFWIGYVICLAILYFFKLIPY